MTLEDAIRMIQIHERARQGRLRAKICQEIRQQEERERLAANRGAPTLDPDIAATRIQKVQEGSVTNYQSISNPTKVWKIDVGFRSSVSTCEYVP